jgi:translation initiation factor 2B subunit (eIF-2B alpha/beta/delta family)
MPYKSPMGDKKKMNSIENLPTELPEKIKTQIEEIRLDNTSGSVKLATRSAETLINLLENVDVSSNPQLIAYIEIVSKELVKAQSTMAPIFNLVNKTLLNIYKLADEEEIRRIAHVFCQNFIKKLDTSGQMISRISNRNNNRRRVYDTQ